MKKKQKYLVLFVALGVVVAVGLLLLNKQSVSTAEIREIDGFIAQANIGKIDGWAVYPNCGDTGSQENGYSLKVNNLQVSQAQASELRSLATNRNYTIKERTDGYEIENNNWNIIVLNQNQSDLFVTIKYPEKPTGFQEGGRVCN